MFRINKVFKWVLVVAIICFVLYLLPGIFFGLQLSRIFNKHYSKKDLIENYEKKEKEISELKTFYNSIVPKDKQVEVEFEGENAVRLIIYRKDTVKGELVYPQEVHWDFVNNMIFPGKFDSILSIVGWTKQTLKTIKSKLDEADCISIKSGEPCNIGFKRNGVIAMYFYNVFDNPVPKDKRDHYNDSCRYIIYNDKLVLEYTTNFMVSDDCFPDKGKVE